MTITSSPLLMLAQKTLPDGEQHERVFLGAVYSNQRINQVDETRLRPGLAAQASAYPTVDTVSHGHPHVLGNLHENLGVHGNVPSGVGDGYQEFSANKPNGV